MRRAERYRAITRGETVSTANDSLARALVEVRDDLASYPLFATLGTTWADAMCGTIDGMTREYFWRRSYRDDSAFVMPTYDEYVANGLYSIGGPPHIWAAIITVGDLSSVDSVEHLSEMEHLSSSCIRLANDLQSYAKELAEENINALIIISQQLAAQGVDAAEAYRQAELRVRAAIGAGLESLGRLQKKAATATGHPEAAVADIARFVCDFYNSHDYHTFYTEDAAKAPRSREPRRAAAAAS
jgi:hypothetical protein